MRLVHHLLVGALLHGASVRRGGRLLATAADGDEDANFMAADEGNDDAGFMAALASRITEVETGTTTAKIVVLRETLVPGQRLRLTAPPALVELFTQRDALPIVLLGPPCRGLRPTRGVEAVMEGVPEFVPVVPNIHPEGTANIVIAAVRTCELTEFASAGASLYKPARVRWLELDDEAPVPPSAEVLARSEALAARVDEWVGLVRRSRRERTPSHIRDVRADLGPMPEAQRPNARALWMAGLLNPVPALGASSSDKFAVMGPSVAPEIRASALMATSVEARISAVEMGLNTSLRTLRKIVGEAEG